MKICVPIKEKDPKKMKKRLLEASKKADLAEIWLDQLKGPDLKKLLLKAPLPVLAACKRKREQGSFTGSYQAQADLLQGAIKNGAKYIDIPLFMPENMNKKIVQYARKNRCKVIISHHDFEKTPSYVEMLKIAEKMAKRGADVVKIAVHNKSLQNAVEVIAVGKYLQGQKTPHILIGMGQKGRLTRILTPTLGGEMMFAVLDKKRQTAQGQLTVDELKKAWKLIKAK
jgi:3-dehydroquinate dehydratase type I